MSRTMRALARYRFGRTVGEAATVPTDLIAGIEGERDGYAFRVFAPDTRLQDDLEDMASSDMWCTEFSIECVKTGSPQELSPDEALHLNWQIARDFFTPLVLNLPSIGFPGELPEREHYQVTIDGERAVIQTKSHFDPYKALIIPPGVVPASHLLRAAEGHVRPSRAQMMVGEARFKTLANRRASPITAVVVAASACEVATHACVRSLANGQVQRLINKIVPDGEQAKLSPIAVIDFVIPVVAGRRLADEDSELWASVKELMRIRNIAVHQGRLPEGVKAGQLVYQAKLFVDWVEALSSPSR